MWRDPQGNLHDATGARMTPGASENISRQEAMDGVTVRSLAVLTKRWGRGPLADGRQKRLCGRAGRSIRSLARRGASACCGPAMGTREVRTRRQTPCSTHRRRPRHCARAPNRPRRSRVDIP
jgi:hypothetical protein